MSDSLLRKALEQMKRTANYGGMSPTVVLDAAGAMDDAENSICMLALALELARARGIDTETEA